MKSFAVFASILLLISCAHPSSAESEPRKGAYILTKDYAISGCTEYEGGRGIVAHCKKNRDQKIPNRRENHDRYFFWDDASKQWGAKVVVFDQFRSIPMTYLELSRE